MDCLSFGYTLAELVCVGTRLITAVPGANMPCEFLGFVPLQLGTTLVKQLYSPIHVATRFGMSRLQKELTHFSE